MKTPSGPVGFACLNLTQFFGAANDNVLKQVLIFGLAVNGLWQGVFGSGAQAWASLCLAIPFVVFSGFAGQFSDRYSKRSVIIVVKLLEIAIALLALWGFWTTNLWIVIFAMVLISVQSAFFTPAKFGILPEITDPPKLSRANGTLNMFTYIAVILGSAVGGAIYDAFAPDRKKFPDADPLLWLPGAVILLVAILGAAASLGLPRVGARNPGLPIKLMFFRTYLETWRDIRDTTLASVIIAWSFFYLIVAGIAILILPDYTELLNISATWTSILMAVLGIFIGIGDFVAGRVSGHAIRPGLIPVGVIPVTLLFFWLGLMPNHFWSVLVALSMTGFMAGFAMVPLQTLTQHLSPKEELGRILGLWTCLSFVGVILGNLIFLLVKRTGMASNRVFLVCGALCLVLTVVYYRWWREPFARAALFKESRKRG